MSDLDNIESFFQQADSIQKGLPVIQKMSVENATFSEDDIDLIIAAVQRTSDDVLEAERIRISLEKIGDDIKNMMQPSMVSADEFDNAMAYIVQNGHEAGKEEDSVLYDLLSKLLANMMISNNQQLQSRRFLLTLLTDISIRRAIDK